MQGYPGRFWGCRKLSVNLTHHIKKMCFFVVKRGDKNIYLGFSLRGCNGSNYKLVLWSAGMISGRLLCSNGEYGSRTF